MNQTKIVSIITTKNRIQLLKNALDSVSKQTVQPYLKILVSDSFETIKPFEKELALKHNFIFVENLHHTHNYAGSLNTVIDYLIEHYFFNQGESFGDFFFASLDDDDLWKEDYLEEIIKVLTPEIDIVVTGIWMNKVSKGFPLSIPETLTFESFLTRNPHIQGSNTFVRLTTLLKAGAFDENMPSTTDRDVFSRLFMLKPKYIIIPKTLVVFNGEENRERISNTFSIKLDGISKFYAKYSGIFSKEDDNRFREQIKRFGDFNLDQELNKMHLQLTPNQTVLKSHHLNPILSGFILSNPSFAQRLVPQLLSVPGLRKIVIFVNHPQVDLSIFDDPRIVLFTLNQVKLLNEQGVYSSFIRHRKLKHNTITDISVARTILHHHVYDEASEDDTIWILDDDMELSEVSIHQDGFINKPLDIQYYIGKYKGDYDVVVGSYSGDTPLPLLSSIRSQLLDYTYQYLFNPKHYDYRLYLKPDYYYDLSSSEIGLETPLPFRGQGLEDVFSSKAISRPLYKLPKEEFTPNSRGGNTLIFNKEALKIQNVSIEVDGVVGRRGDYFWILQLQQQNFRVIASHFSTFHNRKPTPFDYDAEIEKFEKDLIGASFTKAYALAKHPDHFFIHFQSIYLQRMTKFIKNYYRIIGLLSLLPTNPYQPMFTDIKLWHSVKYMMLKVQKHKVKPAYQHLLSELTEISKLKDIERFRIELEIKLGKKVVLLGVGNEGVVFTDKAMVYKIFFNHEIDLTYLKKISPHFKDCEYLHELTFDALGEYTMIVYRYIDQYKPYQGGFTNQFLVLIQFFKSIGVVPTNIKKSNFIVANKVLYYIDYGLSFEPLTEAGFDKFIKRTYQLIRYHFVTENQFKEIIYRSYQGKDQFINFQLEHFQSLLQPRTKETIHDQIVLKMVKDLNPSQVLDYGAGKCKIANELSETMMVSVYDLDKDTLKQRAKPSINILDQVEGKYDVVISNLVLCVVNEKEVKAILKKINESLLNHQHAIISICNPFFNDVERTELRTNIQSPNYHQCSCYDKITPSKTVLHEYHRPYERYVHWFHQYGFEIDKVIQTEGLNFNSLNRISNHLVFKLIKKRNVECLPLTLLIKSSVMDHRFLDSQVKHIVTQLEQGFQFHEKIVLLDDVTHPRTRAYDHDDHLKTLSILEDLQTQEWIDRVIKVSEHHDKKDTLFSKYFRLTSTSDYADNGQPLFANLLGFESIQTPYVFHTDIDILFHQKQNAFLEAFETFKGSGAISASLSIYHGPVKDSFLRGHRVEVRNSFLFLPHLFKTLPWKNHLLENGQFALPWHRAYDVSVDAQENLRLISDRVYFIHPQNIKKKIPNFIQIVEGALTLPGLKHAQTQHEVDLSGDITDWVPTTNKEMVLFIRGFNTLPEKLNRLFDSLKVQTDQDFQVIYIDDASTNSSASYMRFLIQNDTWIQSKVISIFNHENIGSLANQVFAMQTMVKNDQAIIINIDNDDALITDLAIANIRQAYQDKTADVTLGNVFRYDKPVKDYQLIDIRWPWERHGDNIWLHPKTFRKYLFDQAIPYLKDEQGHYYRVNTDFAMMLPILYFAKNPIFIDKVLYYFEPSNQNQLKLGVYDEKLSTQVKMKLLNRWRNIYEKDHHHHWR
jgi:glycosyltransferase involved in cell wall biosynthesis